MLLDVADNLNYCGTRSGVRTARAADRPGVSTCAPGRNRPERVLIGHRGESMHGAGRRGPGLRCQRHSQIKKSLHLNAPKLCGERLRAELKSGHLGERAAFDCRP